MLVSFQNKILRIATDAPWFVRNTQLHSELNMPTIEQFVKKVTKKFLDNIINCTSAVHYKLGHKKIHRRLKRKLPQNILNDSDVLSDGSE